MYELLWWNTAERHEQRLKYPGAFQSDPDVLIFVELVTQTLLFILFVMNSFVFVIYSFKLGFERLTDALRVGRSATFLW